MGKLMHHMCDSIQTDCLHSCIVDASSFYIANHWAINGLSWVTGTSQWLQTHGKLPLWIPGPIEFWLDYRRHPQKYVSAFSPGVSCQDHDTLAFSLNMKVSPQVSQLQSFDMHLYWHLSGLGKRIGFGWSTLEVPNIKHQKTRLEYEKQKIV